MKTLLTLLAFALLCGFLYILVKEVWRTDLSLVVGATLLLAFWDLFIHDHIKAARTKRAIATSAPRGEQADH